MAGGTHLARKASAVAGPAGGVGPWLARRGGPQLVMARHRAAQLPTAAAEQGAGTAAEQGAGTAALRLPAGARPDGGMHYYKNDS